MMFAPAVCAVVRRVCCGIAMEPHVSVEQQHDVLDVLPGIIASVIEYQV